MRPENSLAAFRAASDRGFPIELDVQLTSDGQLVVLHDRKLERMTGDPREVLKVPAAEVTALPFLGSTEMNWKSRPDFISYELDGLPSFGTWLQKCRGRPLIVWTARTRAQYERARKLGDNVMFELDAAPDR